MSISKIQPKFRSGPLSGIKIIDLTHMLAGPYCTWLLGALGAQIIKIELPGRGDLTRKIAPFVDRESIYFMSVNRNKRSVTLNLKQPSGRAALLRMVQKADVFIENNRPGVMHRLQLDYDSVARVNPKIIYASISGFGQTGPYKERPAFDAIVQAMSGLMSITGEEDGPPVRTGASIGDIGGSLFAAIGILASLADRSATGLGAHVDVAMLDAQMALLENAVARYLNAGDQPRRLGSKHSLIAPFQAFPTQDEPIVICVETQEQWGRFCNAIGRAELIKHPLFKYGNLRVRHRDKLDSELTAALSKFTRAQWLNIFLEADVPAGPINDVAAALKCPQVIARGTISNVGSRKFVRQPIKFSNYPNEEEAPAPSLGHDTVSVLREYGYSIREINVMKTEGVI